MSSIWGLSCISIKNQYAPSSPLQAALSYTFSHTCVHAHTHTHGVYNADKGNDLVTIWDYSVWENAFMYMCIHTLFCVYLFPSIGLLEPQNNLIKPAPKHILCLIVIHFAELLSYKSLSPSRIHTVYVYLCTASAYHIHLALFDLVQDAT